MAFFLLFFHQRLERGFRKADKKKRIMLRRRSKQNDFDLNCWPLISLEIMRLGKQFPTQFPACDHFIAIFFLKPGFCHVMAEKEVKGKQRRKSNLYYFVILASIN